MANHKIGTMLMVALLLGACGQRPGPAPPTDAEIAHKVEMWSGFDLPADARVLTEDHARRGWSFSFLTEGNPAELLAEYDAQVTAMGFAPVSRMVKVTAPVAGLVSSHRSKYADIRVQASKTPKGTLVGIEKVDSL